MCLLPSPSLTTVLICLLPSYLIIDIVGKRFFGKDFEMTKQGRDTLGLVAATSGNRRLIHTLARLAQLKSKVLFKPPFSWFFLPRPGDGTPFGDLLKVRWILQNILISADNLVWMADKLWGNSSGMVCSRNASTRSIGIPRRSAWTGT